METKRHTKNRNPKESEKLNGDWRMETHEKQNPKVLNPIIGPKTGF